MNDQAGEGYFDKAQSWATESDHALKRSRKMAWIVASAAMVLALVQAFALFALLPLKETETLALLVDRTTGYVQEIDPASASRIRADEALTQSLLAQYVTAREGYDRSTVQTSYRKAALWSAGAARQAYINQMTGEAATNPAVRFRPDETLGVEVKSVSQPRPGSALVRFDTFLTTATGQTVRDGSYISVVDYHFSDAPMSYDDRLINPLGLQVTRYRRDAERPIEPRPTLLSPIAEPAFGEGS